MLQFAENKPERECGNCPQLSKYRERERKREGEERNGVIGTFLAWRGGRGGWSRGNSYTSQRGGRPVMAFPSPYRGYGRQEFRGGFSRGRGSFPRGGTQFHQQQALTPATEEAKEKRNRADRVESAKRKIDDAFIWILTDVVKIEREEEPTLSLPSSLEEAVEQRDKLWNEFKTLSNHCSAVTEAFKEYGEVTGKGSRIQDVWIGQDRKPNIDKFVKVYRRCVSMESQLNIYDEYIKKETLKLPELEKFFEDESSRKNLIETTRSWVFKPKPLPVIFDSSVPKTQKFPFPAVTTYQAPTYTRVNDGEYCLFCEDAHKSIECRNVVDLKTRLDIVKRKKMCMVCLRGHKKAINCHEKKLRRCGICQASTHHQAICHANPFFTAVVVFLKKTSAEDSRPELKEDQKKLREHWSSWCPSLSETELVLLMANLETAKQEEEKMEVDIPAPTTSN